MEQEILETFHNSLQRCSNHQNFLDRFYEIFISSSPQIKEKFADTDLTKQKQILKSSFYMIMLASQGNTAAEEYLGRVAERHSKNELDIKPLFYQLWLEALVRTVKEFDEEYSSDVDESWRAMMKFGIDYMVSRY